MFNFGGDAFNFHFYQGFVMRQFITVLAFLISFFGTIVAGGVALFEILLPNVDGAHFACAAIAFFLMAVFFFFIRDEVES